MQIPVIDLFSGCGGFAEGFVSRQNRSVDFRLGLAVDNDPKAHETHLLRDVFHSFENVPDQYYRLLRGEISLDEFYGYFPEEHEESKQRVLLGALGSSEKEDEIIHSAIRKNLGGAKNWVLIGGPPCQAYSNIGKARRKGMRDYSVDNDQRHVLYREYLKVLAKFRPSVFVMENVPGVFSTKYQGRSVWPDILADLANPSRALDHSHENRVSNEYKIYSLVTNDRGADIFGSTTLKEKEFVVAAENYGVPQSRHRVIILGVRADISIEPKLLQISSTNLSCMDAISDLPRLRSRLSRQADSYKNWLTVVRAVKEQHWYTRDEYQPICEEIDAALSNFSEPENGTGSEFIASTEYPSQRLKYHRWVIDKSIGGVCNHVSKAHMQEDIHRYLFLAARRKVFADETSKLRDLPPELLPKHKNVSKDLVGSKSANTAFTDRFFVQPYNAPSRTIVSHIAKDGHAFIHPDPKQARAFTPREAARLQTFPDNFFFPVPKTEQYKQIGNAVPPLLAAQIAEVVQDILRHTP